MAVDVDDAAILPAQFDLMRNVVRDNRGFVGCKIHRRSPMSWRRRCRAPKTSSLRTGSTASEHRTCSRRALVNSGAYAPLDDSLAWLGQSMKTTDPKRERQRLAYERNVRHLKEVGP